MGYKVDFDALDTLYYSINNKAVEWSEALGGVHESVNNLAASDCITGAGAENIKSYLSEVHSMVIGLLGRIISAHADNCLLYKRAYQDNIDTSVHAVILEDELTDIIGDLHVYQNQTYSVDCQIRSALTSISDIFYNQSYRGYSTVDDDFETTKNKVKTLDKDIHSLENSHLNSDFTNTEALLEKLTAYLNTQLSKPKSYKTEFSLEQAQKDPTLQEIALAYKALSEESDAKRTALKTAGENEQARVEILQKEYEERQQTATIINWVVTGLCIVGSIAITVATCGAASPLAVALTVGAVSAGSGVIMAGTQSITSQWVETGDLSKTDWLDVGKCSLIAGVTGFVTGFVSAGVGGVVTSKLASAAVTAPLINSSSTVTRVATHVVIGSASEVASGTVSRFAGGIISTGDVEESLNQAFDPKNILFDAALGGAMSGVQGLKKPQQSYADLMSPEDAAKYRQFLEHGSTSGFTSPELKAFDKVDEALLMNRIDYDEVLSARKSAIPNSDGTLSGVQGIKKPQHNSVISNTDGTISGVQEINKPRPYSGDLMTPEDAARYSEHWRQLGIGSDETWSAFKEHYPNGTIDDYLDIVKKESPWPPSYTPKETVLKSGDRFFMAVEKNAKSNKIGNFGVKERIPSKDFVRNNLAVKEKWKPTCNVVREYEVREGFNLRVNEGPTGPQIDLENNVYLPGDPKITQYELFNHVNKSADRQDFVRMIDKYWVD